MGFSQALSGLNAAATSLDVIGNNIANSQTVGYKGGSALFADVYAGAQAGLGTRVSAVMQDFSTGTLEGTNRSLDLAISGGGFFRYIQNDQVVYSRNGQLKLDSDGYLINAQGARLTGYAAGTEAGGNLVELQVPTGGMQANATTAINGALNLDSSAGTIDRLAIPFDRTDADTYSYANNVTTFDSQGNAVSSTLYFSKVAPNTWEVRMSRGADMAAEVGTLNFDNNGILSGTAGIDGFGFAPGGGVNDLAIALNLQGTTQFANDFELSAVRQDGHTSGSLVGIAIDNSGRIIGNYSNEQAQTLGTIGLASFSNPEGLKPVGDNAWLESTNSGQPILGTASSGMFGSIESGALENSNVDLAGQLVKMIIAQRNYQANAQSIKTQDDVLQTAVNLR